MDIRTRYERLLDRYRNGDLERRTFLGLLGISAAAAGVGGTGLTAFTRHARAAVTEVRYDGWGAGSQAALQHYVFEPFEKRSGIKVNQGSYGSTEQLLAKVMTGSPGQYNYFSPSTQLGALDFIERGYSVALDEKKIPALGNLITKVVDSYRALGKGTLPAIPSSTSIQMLAYNRDKVDKAYVEQMGENILLDPKYKGQIAGENYWLRRMLHASLQSGQDPNDMKNIDAVWDKIRESKKIVFKYWTTGAELTSLLETGEALITDAWGQPVYNMRKQGYPIEVYIADGAILTIGSFMPLKDSPMEPFYEMVDILLQPDVVVALALQAGTVPLIDPTKFSMPDEVKAIPAFDPTGKMEKFRPIDAMYWSAHATQWQQQYTRVYARG